MKVDISRETFAPALHFSRVLLQQGRVQLDADFNEQIAILLHYLRTLATDVIGPHGGPADDRLGFALYNNATLPNPPQNPPSGYDALNFIIGPGHYFVGGLLCENDSFLMYQQADKPLPFPVQPDPPDVPLKVSTSYVAYLDAWERLVTIVQNDHIREVALGGADTAARMQVVYHIRVQEVQDVEEAKKRLEFAKLLRTNPETLLTLIRPVPPAKGAAKLRARVDPGSSSIADEVCTLPPDSQYRGDENQLYRVEIHTDGTAGTAGKATFVWARDNASIVFPIVSAHGAVVTLESLGRDALQALEVNDWVEYVNDKTPAPGVGELYQVRSVDPVGRTVTLQKKDGSDASISADAKVHPFLRRWDYTDPAPNDTVGTGASPALPADDGALQVPKESDDPLSGWIDLEDGVQIQFAATGATYLAGDYWLIPARTATGDVEWPTQTPAGGDKPVPVALPAKHVEHHFAPLWLFSVDKNGLVDTSAATLFDLRRRIEPIAKPLTT
ncbi:MAG TPA: DUF6519 domain-containing protein [Isosphaeraceae bacterium]|jgi:hypothetical protein|nr:DUF6519 domain-containing protein [Isosphaeraceae bacterium]